jgi:hypothetical protein
MPAEPVLCRYRLHEAVGAPGNTVTRARDRNPNPLHPLFHLPAGCSGSPHRRISEYSLRSREG